MRYWFLWEVALPVSVIGSFWPFERFIGQSAQPFQDAFCQGDLLLFSALLLMGVAMHVKMKEILWRRSGLEVDLGFTRDVTRYLALLSIFLYGAIRVHLMNSHGAVGLDLMTGYACAGWSAVVLAIGQGVYAMARSEQCWQKAQKFGQEVRGG